MKYSFIFFTLNFFFGVLNSQVTIESGAELNIESGASILLEGNLVNDGIISGKGAITVEGDFNNTGTLSILIGPDQNTHTKIDVLGTFSAGGLFTVIEDNYNPSNVDQSIVVTSNALLDEFSNDQSNSWIANYNLPDLGDFTVSFLGSLSVEYSFLIGELIKTKVKLSWQTLSEINNNGFEIQRSSDAINWTAIGFEKGNINSIQNKDYIFFDELPLLGTSYYRLKQIDLNDTFEYSDIISIHNDKISSINVYPNPTKGLFEISGENINSIKITNDLGKIVYEKIDLQNNFIELSNLSSGLYFVTIYTSFGVTTKTLIII